MATRWQRNAGYIETFLIAATSGDLEPSGSNSQSNRSKKSYNMDNAPTSFIVKLRGIRPILFDRYGGDNKTKLEPKDKAYLNDSGELGIPVLNVFSMLSAENTASVAKRFYGKQGREVALGVMSFVNIEAADGNDPMVAPLLDEDGKVYVKTDARIRILSHVARLPKGIPNPKERPMVPNRWQIRLRVEHQENSMLNVATLRRMIEQAGILGLGTFRPIFGRFVAEFES